MKEPIQTYFKIGTLQWMSFPKTAALDSLRSLCRDDFFDAIELTAYNDENERKKARELLEQSHLQVCFAAQPLVLGKQLNPNSTDEVKRRAAEYSLKEALNQAAFFGSRSIAFLAGKWEEATREEAYSQLLKTTRSLCDAAAEKGMSVELEVFDYDMDKAVLIGPAPLAARFAEDMRRTHDNFGLLVDLSHIPTTHETSRFVIQTLKPYITHLHFGNAVVQPGCDAYGDKHPRLGYPNSANDIPQLTEYLRVLKEEGFFRPEAPYVLSMEVTPRPGEDEEVILANTKRCLRRAWAMLEE